MMWYEESQTLDGIGNHATDVSHLYYLIVFVGLWECLEGGFGYVSPAVWVREGH